MLHSVAAISQKSYVQQSSWLNRGIALAHSMSSHVWCYRSGAAFSAVNRGPLGRSWPSGLLGRIRTLSNSYDAWRPSALRASELATAATDANKREGCTLLLACSRHASCVVSSLHLKALWDMHVYKVDTSQILLALIDTLSRTS